ncbi:MAG: hypothetical protein JWP45_92 [Mucilaginibacter sp.]|nr:hypothetical protein [Mucilaginibacter sp.]
MNTKDLKKLPYLSILLIGLLPLVTKAQSIKDWYWPERNFNKVTFYMPDLNTEKPTAATRIIYYNQNGYYDKTHHPKFTNYEIIDIQLLNNRPGLVNKKTIEFIGNEVKIKREERQLIESNNINTADITPPKTIFKLPQKGLTENWISNGEKYTASWTKITTVGVSEDAIKVVQYTPKLDASTIQYYVKGYGLVETIIKQGKLSVTILDKFHQRLFDEDLYKDDLSRNITFNFLKTDDIFNSSDPQSYDETQSYFSAIEKKQNNYNNQSGEYHSKATITAPLASIPQYEKLVINNIRPNSLDVQTKYDDKDFRVILWNDKLYNKSLYNEKNLKDLGYDYMGVTEDDNGHITYSYRNCEKNLILDVTEWYNIKLSIYISWYSTVVKNSSGRFIGCSSSNN